MRPNAWIALVLIAALAGAGIGARAAAQEPAKPAAPAPSRWEYKVFAMAVPDYKDKDDYKAALERNDGNELRADGEFKSYVLDYLAQDGWELVQVVVPKNDLTLFYLRRPRTGAPDTTEPGSGGPLPGPDRERRLKPPK